VAAGWDEAAEPAVRDAPATLASGPALYANTRACHLHLLTCWLVSEVVSGNRRGSVSSMEVGRSEYGMGLKWPFGAKASLGFLNRVSEVRVLPGAPILKFGSVNERRSLDAFGRL
jgi:hypothetical protein